MFYNIIIIPFYCYSTNFSFIAPDKIEKIGSTGMEHGTLNKEQYNCHSFFAPRGLPGG